LPEAELPANRGLHACPVEDLSLDFRRGDRFRANRFHRELFPIGSGEVLDGASEHACSHQEMLLRLAQASWIPREIGPVGLLPVPLHER
jgi:hypothetical protein